MRSDSLAIKFGMEPGPTLTALVDLARQVAPLEPWNAFGALWLYLPWLHPGSTIEDLRIGTPKNVYPFAETGGNSNHFGFLMDEANISMDERPIVAVHPRDDDDATEVVAPNLRSFLGLVATAFAEVIFRDVSDEEWATFRTKWYGDNPERLRDMELLSQALCTIPGVARPTSPLAVTLAHPDQAFQLQFHDEPETRLPEPREFTRPPDDLDEARRANLFAASALADGRIEEALQHARSGSVHPASKPRSYLVGAEALWRMKRKREAESLLSSLVDAWLDQGAVSPPAVHPRHVIDAQELIALVKLVKGASAGRILEQLENPPPVDELAGDLL